MPKIFALRKQHGLLLNLLLMFGYGTARAQITLEVIHDFVASGTNPVAALVRGTDGSLYGTTRGGGAFDGGTVFKIAADGANFTTLHSFDCGATDDGCFPTAGLIQLIDGSLYGTTANGGASGLGTVFKIDTDGANFTVLHSFDCGATDGCLPLADLIQGSDSSLYGTTQFGGASNLGTVFKIDANGANFTILHSFAGGGNDGSFPAAGLIQGNDDSLYGTTRTGGAFDLGTVFKLGTDGANFTILHSFGCVATDGCNPRAGLIQLIDGSLYGTTWRGGAFDGGTVFKLDPDGANFSLLHSFACDGDDGCNPFAGLIKATDGNLYGTTESGGLYGVGIVYRLVNTIVPDITVAPTSLGFGAVAVGQSSANQIVTVRNDGTVTLSLGAVSVGGADANQFSKAQDNCSKKNLAPNATCTVAARFRPTSNGPKTANLVIPSNDPDENPFNISLSGTGGLVGDPDITVSPTALDFGSVRLKKTSPNQIVTVRNDGPGNLTLGAITLGGDNANQFAKASDKCSNKTLAPNASCTVAARFKPTSTGPRSGILIIPSNDLDENPVNVALSGTGTP